MVRHLAHVDARRAHATQSATRSARDGEKTNHVHNNRQNEIFKYWCLMCPAPLSACIRCGDTFRSFEQITLALPHIFIVHSRACVCVSCIGNILPVDAQISGNLFFRTAYRHYSGISITIHLYLGVTSYGGRVAV